MPLSAEVVLDDVGHVRNISSSVALLSLGASPAFPRAFAFSVDGAPAGCTVAFHFPPADLRSPSTPTGTDKSFIFWSGNFFFFLERM